MTGSFLGVYRGEQAAVDYDYLSVSRVDSGSIFIYEKSKYVITQKWHQNTDMDPT